ncbi:MAG: hypothetical protein KH544_04955 [Firmicutes bacterium]|nr:hypothetical protein [Bacillota bacterium]
MTHYKKYGTNPAGDRKGLIGQERFVSKFCDLIRRGFEAILDVLQEIATKSECKISAKRRSFNCAVLP